MSNCITNIGLEDCATSSPLQIDLPGTLTRKLGRQRMRFVPKWLIRWLEKVICVPQMNALLEAAWPATGGDFARRVLEVLDVRTHVVGTDRLPDPNDRRVMLVSNHPLGGIEGMALIDLMSRHFGGRVYVMVNDMLMAIEPLREVFLPVNKHGRQDHATALRVEEALASDNPVLIFPAGLVSRLLPRVGVHDLPWKPAFVNLAVRHGRKVVPVSCGGRNSMFFYRLARWRRRLGIGLNIEMVRLPREVFGCQGTTLPIVIGDPVDAADIKGGPQARQTADDLCRRVYSLARQVPTNI